MFDFQVAGHELVIVENEHEVARLKMPKQGQSFVVAYCDSTLELINDGQLKVSYTGTKSNLLFALRNMKATTDER